MNTTYIKASFSESPQKMNSSI